MPCQKDNTFITHFQVNHSKRTELGVNRVKKINLRRINLERSFEWGKLINLLAIFRPKATKAIMRYTIRSCLLPQIHKRWIFWKTPRLLKTRMTERWIKRDDACPAISNSFAWVHSPLLSHLLFHIFIGFFLFNWFPTSKRFFNRLVKGFSFLNHCSFKWCANWLKFF